MKYGTHTINKALLADLFKKFGYEEFTYDDAYAIYSAKWQKMNESTKKRNVRNSLVGATDEGLLTRVRPGVYVFDMAWYEYIV